MPLGSFSLNDILELSKTSLMDVDTPTLGMQSSHLVGNICIDLTRLAQRQLTIPQMTFTCLTTSSRTRPYSAPSVR